jgi:hypothetical protein
MTRKHAAYPFWPAASEGSFITQDIKNTIDNFKKK